MGLSLNGGGRVVGLPRGGGYRGVTTLHRGFAGELSGGILSLAAHCVVADLACPFPYPGGPSTAPILPGAPATIDTASLLFR